MILLGKMWKLRISMAVIGVAQLKFRISRRSSIIHPSSDLGVKALEAIWAGEGKFFFVRL